MALGILSLSDIQTNGQIDWGGLPSALVEESIERYATEIAPQVRSAVSPSVAA